MPRLMIDDVVEDLMTKATVSILNIILVLLLSKAVTSAALVQADDLRYGAGTLTLDTSSGLAWLDLPVSRGFSYLQALAATQPGGAFDGFRFATAQEVIALCASAGIPGPNWHPETASSLQPILSLISFVGATSSQDGRPEAHGISGTVLQRLPLGHGLGFLVSDRCSRLWRRWASRADAWIRYRRHSQLAGLCQLAR